MTPAKAAAAGLCVLLLAAALADPARAQRREFAGTVVTTGATLVVENRRGERIGFARADDTVVEGKGGWDALAVGDRVIVRWSLADGPRRARRVIVLGGR